MNAVVDDAEMVNVILQGVVDSHRNVVRMFNRNNNEGAAPDLATVVNVLLGEAETDKACATEAARKEAVQITKVMVQHPAPQNPKKKFKKAGRSKMVNQESRKCFFCKKKGHLRADCFGWKALQEKKCNKGATAMKMVWSGVLGDHNNPPVPIRMARNQNDTPPTGASTHDWMLDSGAGAHVCVDGGSFLKLVKDPLLTLDWKGGLKTNEYAGSIRLEKHGGKFVDLPAVRYAPGGTVNLISQRLLEEGGWKPSYSDTDDERSRCMYFDKDEVRLDFKKRKDEFDWMIASPVLQTSMMVARSVETLEDNIVMKWHLKLAHLNEAAMKKMVKEGLANGMDGITLDAFMKTPLKCMACDEAKSKRMTFKRQVGKRTSECGARLMSDVCYVGITTPGRAKYFQLIQDEASRYKWVFLLNKKSEAADNVMVLIRQLEKDFKVKMFSCDQGGKFLNYRLATFFRENGIRLLTTNAYTPEENCLVEKLNGKLLGKVRAIREAANLPPCLWGEILHYVVHVDNMSVTKALKDMTPYEKLWSRKPDMKDLKICGCVAYYHVPKQKQLNKLEMRARPAMFLGMAESTLGYHLLHLETGEILQCRSVRFCEDVAVGGDYVERLMARQYYGVQTSVPNQIPYVLMPVTHVAVSDSPSENAMMLPENAAETNDAEVKHTNAKDCDVDGDSDSSDDSDWDYVETVEAAETHGGACAAAENRANSSAVPNQGANMGSQTAGASGSTATSTTGMASPAGADLGTSTRVNTSQSSSTVRTQHGNTTQALASAPRRTGRQRRLNNWYDPATWIMTMTLMQCMMIGIVNDILNLTTRQEALKSEHAEGWRRAMDLEYEALMRNET